MLIRKGKKTLRKSTNQNQKPKHTDQNRKPKHANTQTPNKIQRNTKFLTNLSMLRLGRDDETNWDDDEEDEDKPNHGFCVL
jgi:hypothetical protein